MEHAIHAVEAASLVIAWLIASRYLARHWPSLRRQMSDVCRGLGDEVRAAFPDLHLEIKRLADRLRTEIGAVFPVFSAETTDHREAELIDDRRRPGRPIPWTSLLVIIAIAGLVWWFTR